MPGYGDYANAAAATIQAANAAVQFGQSVGIGSNRAQKNALNYNKQLQEQAFEYNKQLAAYQNEMAISNWQRENAYNTPQEQMNRYLAAGLNPNLVYGAGASSGNAGNIGTPTVGGVQDPSSIGDMITRRQAQRMNAAQIGLQMVNQSADVFEKLLTLRGKIQSINAGNAVNTARGMFDKAYYNSFLQDGLLDSYVSTRNRAAVSSWLAEDTENQLRNRIGLYKTFGDGSLTDNERLYRPYYVQDLDTRLSKFQADLSYQNLMNHFREASNTLFDNPLFGGSAQAQKEMEKLDAQIGLLGAQQFVAGLQGLNLNRQYHWMPFNNIVRGLSSFIPKFSFGSFTKHNTYSKNY